MNKTLGMILIVLIISFYNGYGQKVTVQGRVVDSETKQALPYSQIQLKSSDDSLLVKGTVSNDRGTFVLDKVKIGEYNLSVSFLGYEPKEINRLSLGRGDALLNLGDILLNVDRKKLAEFKVSGQASSTVKYIEKQVYNANEFLSAKGGTAVDIIKSIPSVQLSPDGEVSVRGTGDFMVYLNGKPTQIDPSVLLAQIDANSIDKVELITVPTARYESQGKGGIINVLTKKATLDGTSISMSLMGGGSPQYAKLDPLRYGGSVNFVHQKGDFSWSGGLDYKSRDVRGRRVGEARILQEDGSYYWMNADGDRPEWHQNYSARLGLDWTLNDNNTLGFGFYHGKKIEGRSAYYTYDNFYGDINGVRLDDIRNNLIFNPNSHERDGLFTTGSVDYTAVFNNSSRLKISALYEKSRLWGNLTNEDYKETRGGEKSLWYKQYDNNPLEGVRLDVSFSKPFLNGSELTLGYQPQYVNQKGEFEFEDFNFESEAWEHETEFENSTDLKRWIHAAFLDFNGSLGQLNYIAGLRAEYMDQKFEVENAGYLSLFDRENTEFSIDKLDLFPVLHLQYELNSSDHLILAYSRRINRPPTKNMSPFLLRRHYEVFLVGDPSLKPEYSNIAELSFTKGVKQNKLTLTGFYRTTENAIYRVNTRLFGNTPEYPWYTGNSVLIRSYTNSGNNRAIGAELSGDGKITDWWKFYVGASLYHFNIEGNIFGFEVDQNSLNYALNANTNIVLRDDLKFFYTFNLQSGTVTAQGQNDVYFVSDAVLAWTPRQMKNLSISLKAEDIFNSNIKGLDTKGNNMMGEEIFYQETTYYRYGPIFELNITYSFNKTNGKSKKIDSTFGKQEF